jgi:hypothetical protein
VYEDDGNLVWLVGLQANELRWAAIEEVAAPETAELAPPHPGIAQAVGKRGGRVGLQGN